MRFGIKNKNMVVGMYREEMNSEGKAVELFDVGLCVYPSLPYLGPHLIKEFTTIHVRVNMGG